MVNRSSTYGSLPNELASILPKKTRLRDTWLDKKVRPLSNIEVSTNIEIQELIAKGKVEERKSFFEAKPLAPKSLSAEKTDLPKPVSTEIRYKVSKIPYQIGKRQSEQIQCIIHSEGEISNISSETLSIKRSAPKPRINRVIDQYRRQTISICSDISHSFETQKPTPVGNSKNDSKSQKNALASQVESSHYLETSEGTCAKLAGVAVNCQSAESCSVISDAKENTKFCDRDVNNLFYSVEMGIAKDSEDVPRIVGAHMKSFREIPEELFNKLPESSVDPSSDESPNKTANNDWKNMREGRQALLSQNGPPSDTESLYIGSSMKMSLQNDRDLSIYSEKEKHSLLDVTTDEEEPPILPDRNSKSKPPPPIPPRLSLSSTLPFKGPSLTQLELDLRAAGVFFRRPSFSKSKNDIELDHEDEQAALQTLDASLEGLSETSSESSSTVQSCSTSFTEQYLNGPLDISASKDNKCVDVYSGSLERNYNYEMKTLLNGRTLVHVSGVKTGSSVDEAVPTIGTAIENLNLIEEMYISSKTHQIPPSSVQITAYYPSVNFENPTIGILAPDSDSGHESGATSPCGTLTGEDTSSPPASPSTSKQTNENKINKNSDIQVPTMSSTQVSHVYSTESAKDGIAMAAASLSIDDKVEKYQSIPCPSNHFVVVAVDFGTTYSGYAFSFTREPENIHMMKRWEGGDPGIQNQKTPTIVLLSPDEQFHSLGFTARDTFHDLDPKQAAKWLYFDKFKMDLHSNQSLTRNTLLEASNGHKISALKIFSFALRYFRDHALKELSDHTGVQINESDVRWVITVPAIWSHPAKQFMRTAAYEANMGDPSRPEQLLIALEPEAAAIYCRRLRRNQLLPDRTRPKTPNPPEEHHSPPPAALKMTRETECPPTPELDRGTSYMVVDCGGGTVDITVHQMTDRRSGHLKELLKASGGPYGSTGVDNEFKKLLNTIFTENFMTTFQTQRPAACVDLMVAFESRKRTASPYKSTPLNIALPFSFIDLYKKTKGKEIESTIRKHSNLGVKWSSQGMLRIEQEAMSKLFTPTLIKISEAINSALSSPEVGSLQYMFLVGGFCESEHLQKHLRDEFGSRVNVIIPQGMGLAILRGAVQFGLDPSVVTVRRSRLTYGVGVLNRFQEDLHPPEKRVTAAGSEWCADVLDKFVCVDESVAVGDVVTRSYTPATPCQKTVILHLYATAKEDAKYVTDDGVEKVGTLHLELENFSESPTTSPPSANDAKINKSRSPREITVHLRFGGTEIRASAVDHATGHCVKSVIEFLSL